MPALWCHVQATEEENLMNHDNNQLQQLSLRELKKLRNSYRKNSLRHMDLLERINRHIEAKQAAHESNANFIAKKKMVEFLRKELIQKAYKSGT